MRVCASVFARRPWTVSTRGEKDPIQTHTAVVSCLPYWPGVDLIRLFSLIKSPMRPRPATFYPCTTKAKPCVRPSNVCESRGSGGRGKSSTSRLKLLLWCSILRKQVTVRFRFVRIKQPSGRLTLAVLRREQKKYCERPACAD